MSELSIAANLLATARNLLRSEIGPTLPDRLRYPVAMIANAMAIASRQLEHGDNSRAEFRVLMARLYPKALNAASLDDLQRRFARDLRAGRFDQEEQVCLRSLLRGCIHLRLRISAPHLAERVRTTP